MRIMYNIEQEAFNREKSSASVNRIQRRTGYFLPVECLLVRAMWLPLLTGFRHQQKAMLPLNPVPCLSYDG